MASAYVTCSYCATLVKFGKECWRDSKAYCPKCYDNKNIAKGKKNGKSKS